MRADASVILAGMGYQSERDFVATAASPSSVIVRWLALTSMPTEAEIDAAAPGVFAANADEDADLARWIADKADLRAAYTGAVTRLTQIRDAASPTNAQVIQSVRDCAGYQVQILKAIKRLVRNG